MVRVLAGRFATVATELDSPEPVDFLACKVLPDPSIRGIITNPPYDFAQEFCEHALKLTRPFRGFTAMLLRHNFDSARTRAHLFAQCPAWALKVTLTQRIVWFTEPNGKPKASPSENHSWYVWDWRHQGPPAIAYAP
jgi:hypothetical protein